MNSTTNPWPSRHFRFLSNQVRYQQLRGATKKNRNWNAARKRSYYSCSPLGIARPTFMNHSAKLRSAVKKCVFFLFNFLVVLLLFCDPTDLLK